MADDQVPLRDHVMQLMEARFTAIDARLDASDRAIIVARQETERRLEGMNELREQVTSERGQYVTRDRFEALYKAQEERLMRLESALAEYRGRLWMLGAALAVLVLAAQILTSLWR